MAYIKSEHTKVASINATERFKYFMYHNRRATKGSVFHNAGWLFADLLLALTIIFIAASATGKPKPAPVPQTLNPNPLMFTINVDPLQLSQSRTIAHVKDQVRQQLKQSHNSNHEVGLVITLAGGENGDNHSMSFNAILKTLPAFQHAVCKNYHNLLHRPSEFDL